ncbi:MAG: glycosyltransferase family 4 protein [Rhodospirillales bacterium]
MPTIAIILKGYPRLSETFIAQEIRALEEYGLELTLVSLRHPTDRTTHPIHDEIRAPVTYLPEYMHHEPARVLRSWRQARRLPGYAEALKIWRRDLRRDCSRNRVRRFGQACVLAAELPSGVDRLYAHFLHTPASVARYAAIMTGLPWMCSAHAKDIYTSPDWELREKIGHLDWLVTCTSHNVEHLRELAAPEHRDRIHLVYHGLDFSRFPDAPSGGASDGPVRILSVGRAVEKKGFPGLLRALSKLPPDCRWRMTHIGGGPLIGQLKDLADSLRIAEKIDWLGPRPQDDVLAAYRNSDIFVLNSRIADDGDRDGLPNVLMEAQSQRVACIATAISAIPELIEDGTTGILVPPDDDTALSTAVCDLIRDPERRRMVAEGGYNRIHERFGMDKGIETLVGLFGARDDSSGMREAG